MTQGVISWTVRIDRRKASREDVLEELQSLGLSIQDLAVDVVAEQTYWDAPDGGAFRDFIPVATISHRSIEALEVVAEELLLTFGWLVDFQRPDPG